MDVVRTAPSTCTVPAKLVEWRRLLGYVRRDVVPLVRSEPARQWTSRELLLAMRRERRGWAEEIVEPHVLDYLLGQVEEVVRVSHGRWAVRTSTG